MLPVASLPESRSHVINCLGPKPLNQLSDSPSQLSDTTLVYNLDVSYQQRSDGIKNFYLSDFFCTCLGSN